MLDYSADLLFMLLKREKNRAFLANLKNERYSKTFYHNFDKSITQIT